MNKLLGSCVATAMTVGLAAVSVAASPADAAIDHKAAVQHRDARALPTRPITLTFQQVGTSIKVRFKGKAQDLVDGRVYLLERRAGTWRQIARTRTDEATRYHFVTKVPQDGRHHKFRTMTPQGGGYARSYSQVLEVYWI